MSAMQVAETIKAQLGHRALYMLGASQLLGADRALQFSIKGCRSINKIRIVLADDDTYTVQFWKLGRGVFKIVAEATDVYVDSLHATIEKHTGLYTSL